LVPRGKRGSQGGKSEVRRSKAGKREVPGGREGEARGEREKGPKQGEGNDESSSKGFEDDIRAVIDLYANGQACMALGRVHSL
jgi:hypothetical protein